jgi:hypothetical protein
LNRALAGLELDPIEVHEAPEPYDATISGDRLELEPNLASLG